MACAGQDPTGPNASASGGLTAPSATPAPFTLIDAQTLDRKLIMGYQGWFFCPGDGSLGDRWVHWFSAPPAGPATLQVDLWPDTSELPASEQCPTGFTRAAGRPAPLYSSYRYSTVLRHFQWIRDYALDGVALQRFTLQVASPTGREARDQVALNVRRAAEQHGRVFFVMYDISDHTSAFADVIKSDWRYLVDVLRLTDSPRYLHHRGKPLLAIWGFGAAGRPGTPAQALELIDFLKQRAEPAYQVTLFGGVTRDWRSDPAWGGVFRAFDVVSPWSVGRYRDDAGADAFAATFIGPDVLEARRLGLDYMPVVFPGFSRYNLRNGSAAPLNEIERRGGCFYWRQVHNAIASGASMLYGAMFDEVDEGTAMYKLAPTRGELPREASLLPLDADGYALPSDFYLRLAGESSRMLRGETPLSPRLPIAPESGPLPACR